MGQVIEALTDREKLEIRDGLSTNTLRDKFDNLVNQSRKLILDEDTVDFSELSDGVNFETEIELPDNAILVRTYYDVITTFVGNGDDSSTLQIGSGEASNDIVAATAIKTAGNAWDAGLHEGIQVGTMATAIKTTAVRKVTIQLNIAATDTAITAGRIKIFVEYKLSE